MSERAGKIIEQLAADLDKYDESANPRHPECEAGHRRPSPRGVELSDEELQAMGPVQQEREWAAMREDRNQFERRALAAEAELRETMGELEKALQTIGSRRLERTAFIRQAAVAIYAGHYDQDCADHTSGPHHALKAAWRIARDLWDAKPEDC